MNSIKDYPSSPLLQLFRACVETKSNHTALKSQGKSVTYSQLDCWSDHIAASIKAAVPQNPSSPFIGVMAGRDITTIAMFLGIWKAGYAYLPIDPALSAERQKTIIDDCRPTLILTDEFSRSLSEAESTLSAYVAKSLLHISNQIPDEPASVLAPTAPCRYAYIIYTSGTTGRPKGVPINQDGLVNLVKARQQFIAHGKDDVELCFSSIAFDASVWEIFPALLTGTTVYFASEQQRHDPLQLLSLLENENITTACIPPVFLSLMPYKPLPKLRHLVVAGEQCPETTIRKWQRTTTVINAYGPTENTVCATAAVLGADSLPNDIGIPLQGVECYLLDDDLHPVADGVQGQLFIGGNQVTDGYLHDEELNSRLFIQQPVVAGGQRLYASGDLAYRQPDGHFIFCGRKDDQVKIHGYRIEPREVASHLMSHEAIEQAVVNTIELNGQKHLRAYVVMKNSSYDLTALKEWMTQQVPPFMVPTVYVPVKEIPLTISGKIDFQALARITTPPAVLPTEDNITLMSLTATEQQIADIWSSLLAITVPLQPDTHFFSLGGDSVSLIMMVQHLANKMGVVVSVEEAYANLCLNQLSALVDEKLSTGAVTPAADTDKETGVRVRSHEILIPQNLLDLMAHCRLSDELSIAYNLVVLIPFDSQLDTTLLQQSWNLLRMTQDALRMTFTISTDGDISFFVSPFQAVESIPLSIMASEEQLWSTINSRLAQPMSTDALCQAHLYKKAAGDYLLAIYIHHTISDGWSAALLRQQLCSIYKSLTRSEMPKLPHLSYSYANYAEEAHTNDDCQIHADYWKPIVKGVDDLHLPYIKGGGAASGSYRASYEQLVLSCQQSQRLNMFCTTHGVTLFSLLASAYMVTLSRYCRQADFVIGYPSAGRDRLTTADIIGYFVHTLPLRFTAQLNTLNTVALCRHCQEAVIGGDNHLATLSQLIAISECQQSPVESPLIQTFISVEEELLENQYTRNAFAHFPLTLLVVKGETEISLQFMYREALFSAPDIQLLLHCLANMLDNMTANAFSPVSSLALASAAEVSDMIARNTISPLRTPDETIISLFRRQVATSRHPWAMKDWREALSFIEIDQQSDSIASQLLSIAPGHGATGLFCTRSCRAIVAMFGILKAGHMYVPLDENHPVERLRMMVEDSGMKCIVCTRDLYDKLTALQLDPDIHILVFEDCIAASVPAGSPAGITADTPAGITADTPAYMIYTSGTTGRPKGVVINHGNVASLVTVGARGRFIPSVDDIVLQYCSYLFDVSVNDIFTTLLHGARLICIGEAERRDPDLLFPLMEREQVTHAYIAPSFLSACRRQPTSALRTLIVGGESPSQVIVDLYTPQLTMINGYGPTENTVFSTSHNYTASQLTAANCIGKPLPGVSGYVLDEYLNPVPVGVAGELYLGGLQVSPGYHKRPELNAKSFIANPYVSRADSALKQNQRIYATGDIVRADAEGNIYYLGRKDFQVKIRGFRVELREIESALSRHPAVSQCLLQTFTSNTSTELAAYVVTTDESLEARQLRDYLAENLPAYMVPAYWYIGTKLPLNTSGKIDRKNLPQPVLCASSSEEQATEAERRCKSVVSKILEVPVSSFSIDDDLVDDLGMNSLHVLELSRQLCDRGYNLRPTDIYRCRTTRAITAYLLSEEGSGQLTDAQIDGRVCYFATPDRPDKPLLLVVCGYPYYEAFYTNFHNAFKDDYTILVLESANELYWLRPSLDLTSDGMIAEYVRLLKPILQKRRIDAMTGLCLGGDFALQLAVSLQEQQLATPNVYIIDGYAFRTEYDEGWGFVYEDGLTEEVNIFRNKVMAALSSTLQQRYYSGHVCLFQAVRFANVPGQAVDEGLQLFPKNRANWLRAQPEMSIVDMEFVHMELLHHPDSLKRMKDIIDDDIMK